MSEATVDEGDKTAESLLEAVFAVLATRQQSDVRFNALSAIRSKHDEVGLHSRFLYALLSDENPKYGSKTQQLFLSSLGIVTEVQRFAVSREDMNIDLLLLSPDRKEAVIIENKIYAVDQKKQLERYLELVRRRTSPGSKIHIVYLTLDGRPPNESSRGSVAESAIRLASYRQHITGYLEKSLGLFADDPYRRESARMYLDIVRELTGDTESMETQQKIKSIIESNPLYLRSAQQIHFALGEVAAELHHRLWTELKNSLGQSGYRVDGNVTLEQTRAFPGTLWFGINFTNQNLRFRFRIEADRDLFVGVQRQSVVEPSPLGLDTKGTGFGTNNGWILWKNLSSLQEKGRLYDPYCELVSVIADPLKFRELLGRVVQEVESSTQVMNRLLLDSGVKPI